MSTGVDGLVKIWTCRKEGVVEGKGKGRSNGPGWWKFRATLNHGTLLDEKFYNENVIGGGEKNKNKKDEDWYVVVKFLQRLLSPCIM